MDVHRSLFHARPCAVDATHPPNQRHPEWAGDGSEIGSLPDSAPALIAWHAYTDRVRSSAWNNDSVMNPMS
jgi:hypothetical protein